VRVVRVERLIRHWPFYRLTELRQQLLQARSGGPVPLDLAGPAVCLGIGDEGQLHLAPAAQARGIGRRRDKLGTGPIELALAGPLRREP
jgi:hypothetical protein